MPREELRELQAKRIRSCLERMRASDNAYYHERLSGIGPEDIRSVDDLRRLPFTVKDDLRDHYPLGLLLAPTKDVVRIHSSSGSTGKPTVGARVGDDLVLWSDTLARGLVAANREERAFGLLAVQMPNPRPASEDWWPKAATSGPEIWRGLLWHPRAVTLIWRRSFALRSLRTPAWCGACALGRGVRSRQSSLPARPTL